MAGRLTGKRILVTAAGAGIGRASVLMMAAEGASVIATDVKPELLESLRGVAGIETRALDVLDDAQVAAVVGAQPLDVLFNCAGWVHQGGIDDCTDRDWQLSFDLNVRAQWKTIAAALPGMLAQGGLVVNATVPADVLNLAQAATIVIITATRRWGRHGF